MDNKFFMLPKEIMQRKLSDGGKLLYALMLDRSNLSLENGWIDENGMVYIFFTVDEIVETMCCSREKAIKMIAELEREELIKRRKQGQGRASVIYVNDSLKPVEKTDVKKSEKPMSRSRKNRSLKVGKTDCNNTDNNNTDKSYTDNKSYPSDGEGWMEKRERLKKRIKKNICYEAITQRFGKSWCDEMVEIMCDTLMSEKPYIKINGEPYPAEAVKSRFLKINDMHISYINDALSENCSHIRNIRQFLLTTIYRSVETMDNWYAAKVNYDMAKT